jgi:hypothetical protein
LRCGSPEGGEVRVVVEEDEGRARPPVNVLVPVAVAAREVAVPGRTMVDEPPARAGAATPDTTGPDARVGGTRELVDDDDAEIALVLELRRGVEGAVEFGELRMEELDEDVETVPEDEDAVREEEAAAGCCAAKPTGKGAGRPSCGGALMVERDSPTARGFPRIAFAAAAADSGAEGGDCCCDDDGDEPSPLCFRTVPFTSTTGTVSPTAPSSSSPAPFNAPVSDPLRMTRCGTRRASPSL